MRRERREEPWLVSVGLTEGVTWSDAPMELQHVQRVHTFTSIRLERINDLNVIRFSGGQRDQCWLRQCGSSCAGPGRDQLPSCQKITAVLIVVPSASVGPALSLVNCKRISVRLLPLIACHLVIPRRIDMSRTRAYNYIWVRFIHPSIRPSTTLH